MKWSYSLKIKQEESSKMKKISIFAWSKKQTIKVNIKKNN